MAGVNPLRVLADLQTEGGNGNSVRKRFGKKAGSESNTVTYKVGTWSDKCVVFYLNFVFFMINQVLYFRFLLSKTLRNKNLSPYVHPTTLNQKLNQMCFFFFFFF